jgi:GDPmannose 4,6-dehydratase
MSNMKIARFIFLIVLGFSSTVFAYKKKALIVGIAGQDGSYLSDFLLGKDYEVYGILKPGEDSPYLIKDHLALYELDIGDIERIQELIKAIRPDEIYNLAAQSNVALSFKLPLETMQVNAVGALTILHAIKVAGLENHTKLFQALSSEIFGKDARAAQLGENCFHPTSPYGVTKLFMYWIGVNYRETYNMFICNGILYNHESPRRPDTFVTRKIAKAAALRACGEKNILLLGNLNALKDWGYALDYVKAMWLMLQQEKPDDYSIASGSLHSVREFVERAYCEIGISIEWEGDGVNEIGRDKDSGDTLIKVDPVYFRPLDSVMFAGNISKAEKQLQWEPTVTFDVLVKIMVNEEIKKCTQALGTLRNDFSDNLSEFKPAFKST